MFSEQPEAPKLIKDLAPLSGSEKPFTLESYAIDHFR